MLVDPKPFILKFEAGLPSTVCEVLWCIKAHPIGADTDELNLAPSVLELLHYSTLVLGRCFLSLLVLLQGN